MPERPVSAFSRSFAVHLKSVLGQYGVKQQAIADLLGKSPGYVSEHLSGKRAVDSDLIDAVAELADIESRDLVLLVVERMSTNIPRRATPEEHGDRIGKRAAEILRGEESAHTTESA